MTPRGRALDAAFHNLSLKTMVREPRELPCILECGRSERLNVDGTDDVGEVKFKILTHHGKYEG